ncbi:hypothetical protein J6O48_07400 [bacterium]|nr:hypothetical protein [bacterium]
MDYKEKYNAALERMKSWANGEHPECFSEAQKTAEFIFPELKEDKDEKIRKELKHYLEVRRCQTNNDEEYINCNHFLAWLEKQGESDEARAKMFLINKSYPIDANGIFPTYEEMYNIIKEGLEKQDKQKPTDNVKPKFHSGDWIVHNKADFFFKVISVSSNGYGVINRENHKKTISFDNEDNYHLWTIKDTKDGDVLVNGSNIFIFHFLNDTRLMGYCHVNTDDGRFYDDIGKNECFCLIDAVVYPATKEQCDMLFRKMKEAGYEWDSVNKDLKRITKFKIGDKIHCGDETQPITIVDITNDSYTTDSIIRHIPFSEEDNWTLIKPKFNVGDWIVTEDSFGKIVRHIDEISINIIEQRYVVSDENGLIYDISFSNENKWHKWTIQDAEDGDVLVHNNCTFIFMGIKNGIVNALEENLLCDTNPVCFGEPDKDNDYHPATKEQRDFLFQKIEEAGYEWDSEKKELHRIF